VEPAVFEALARSLPDGWTGWHSLRFVHGRKRLFREIDFLLLVPNRGLLVVEVKGGADWRREDGHWYRGGRPVEDDGPLEQVLGAQSALRGALRDSLGDSAVPPAAVALCFPNMFATTRPGGSDLEGRVLLGTDLGDLDAQLRALAARLLVDDRPDLPWARIEDVLHRLWGERWVPSLQLELVRTHRERELVALDAQQRLLARDTTVRGWLLVQGGPGSGKSLVAREAAQRHIEAGRSTLFLCYTRALALGMRRAGIPEAHPIRDFALQALRDNGVEIPAGDTARWLTPEWTRMMDSAAELLAAADIARPQAVVLDEVQDFGPQEWAVVSALAPPGVPVLGFGDPAQRILPHAVESSERFHVELVLRTAYRTPEVLLALAQSVREGGVLKAAESGHFHRERLAAEEPVVQGLDRAVRWLLARKVAPSDIAVLSMGTMFTMTRLGAGARLAGHVPVLADDPAAPERIVLDSAVRFKGLERPWVVLIDTDDLVQPMARTRAYIAITRATMGLVLVDR